MDGNNNNNNSDNDDAAARGEAEARWTGGCTHIMTMGEANRSGAGFVNFNYLGARKSFIVARN